MMSNHDSNDIHSESMPEHITPDVYERLRDRLDHMAKGFPAANGGEELKVLRQLFTPEDAVTFLAMRDADESPADVAARMGGDIADVAKRLENMAKRGLLFRLRDEKGILYRPMPFIVGIYEFQVSRLDIPTGKKHFEVLRSCLRKDLSCSEHSLSCGHSR